MQWIELLLLCSFPWTRLAFMLEYNFYCILAELTRSSVMCRYTAGHRKTSLPRNAQNAAQYLQCRNTGTSLHTYLLSLPNITTAINSIVLCVWADKTSTFRPNITTLGPIIMLDLRFSPPMVPASFWLLVWSIIQPWSWRKYIPPKS
jgi:hypothetical protein